MAALVSTAGFSAFGLGFLPCSSATGSATSSSRAGRRTPTRRAGAAAGPRAGPGRRPPPRHHRRLPRSGGRLGACLSPTSRRSTSPYRATATRPQSSSSPSGSPRSDWAARFSAGPVRLARLRFRAGSGRDPVSASPSATTPGPASPASSVAMSSGSSRPPACGLPDPAWRGELGSVRRRARAGARATRSLPGLRRRRDLGPCLPRCGPRLRSSCRLSGSGREQRRAGAPASP